MVERRVGAWVGGVGGGEHGTGLFWQLGKFGSGADDLSCGPGRDSCLSGHPEAGWYRDAVGALSVRPGPGRVVLAATTTSPALSMVQRATRAGPPPRCGRPGRGIFHSGLEWLAGRRGGAAKHACHTARTAGRTGQAGLCIVYAACGCTGAVARARAANPTACQRGQRGRVSWVGYTV